MHAGGVRPDVVQQFGPEPQWYPDRRGATPWRACVGRPIRRRDLIRMSMDTGFDSRTIRRRRLLLLLAAALMAALSATAAQQTGPAPQPRPPATVAARGDLEVLPVAGSVYLLAGTGANVVVQAGDAGALFVDTSSEAATGRLIAEVQKLTRHPIRYVINTSADPDHVSGNERIAAAGLNFATPIPNLAGVGVRQGGGGRGNGGMRTDGAQVYAHEAALTRMSAPPAGVMPARFELWPTDTFFTMKKTLYFNGEPIELLHLPAAHTDGDVMVFFRKSDVIASGDVFTPDRFPVIDVGRGGSVQGMLDGLNRIIDVTVPEFNQQGGTMVVPGHGRIANESDVVEYRDMATILRDRIQLMVAKRMTLEQVRAANPTRDYDGIYGRNTTWTTAMFLEAMYRDLSSPKNRTAVR
jgi:cyclase